MKLELYGRPINIRRLIPILVLIVAALVAAVIFLPAGMVRLAIVSLLVLPFAMFLFDRPTPVFYLMIIVLFSNIDVYIPFPAYRYLPLFLLVSLIVSFILGRKIVVHNILFVTLTCAFVLIAFTSLIVARDIDSSLYRLSKFVKTLISIAIASQFVTGRKEFRRFFLVLAVSILMSSFLPLILPRPAQYPGPALIWATGVFRYEGFIFDPNVFALMQVFLVPILLFLIAVYRRPLLARPFFLVALTASVAVFVMTFSRAGFVSLASLLFLLIIIERRNPAVLVVVSVLIVAGIILTPDIYWERIKSLGHLGAGALEDYSIFIRRETAKIAIDMGLKHPILGVGIENFLYHLPRYNVLWIYMDLVHNAFLEVLSVLGIIAFSIFLGIIWYNTRVIRNLMKRRHDREARQLGRLLLVQLLAILVHALFMPVTFHFILWYMFAIPSFARYAYR